MGFPPIILDFLYLYFHLKLISIASSLLVFPFGLWLCRGAGLSAFGAPCAFCVFAAPRRFELSVSVVVSSATGQSHAGTYKMKYTIHDTS
jgi:hypothetical protein